MLLFVNPAPETNQSRHSCCDVEVKASGNVSICKECGNKGLHVAETTLKSLITEPALKAIEILERFFFCETPTTQERIFEQIRQSGHSTAVREIGAKVRSGECACDIKNPSGRCCLGNVNKVVKKGMELYGKAR